MTEIRMGICIGDAVYSERFSNYMMVHYRKQFHIHVFSSCEILLGDIPDRFGVLIASDLGEKREELAAAMKKQGTILFYLQENAEEELSEPEDLSGPDDLPEGDESTEGDESPETGYSPKADYMQKTGQEICILEKYQDVEQIMEAVFRKLSETQPVLNLRKGSGRKKIILAVSSLTECALQLPYAVALSKIAAEQKKVLFLDLQENSGFAELCGGSGNGNLEDLLVMAAGGRFSYNRMKGCIGTEEGVEFVYPAARSGCLEECGPKTISGLMGMLLKETDYEVLVLNLESGMQKLPQILGQCAAVYMIHAAGMPGKWRYRDFLCSLSGPAIPNPDSRIRVEEVRIPEVQIPEKQVPENRIPEKSDTDCRTLIAEWIWDENGSRIRRNLQEVMDFE